MNFSYVQHFFCLILLYLILTCQTSICLATVSLYGVLQFPSPLPQLSDSSQAVLPLAFDWLGNLFISQKNILYQCNSTGGVIKEISLPVEWERIVEMVFDSRGYLYSITILYFPNYPCVTRLNISSEVLQLWPPTSPYLDSSYQGGLIIDLEQPDVVYTIMKFIDTNTTEFIEYSELYKLDFIARSVTELFEDVSSQHIINAICADYYGNIIMQWYDDALSNHLLLKVDRNGNVIAQASFPGNIMASSQMLTDVSGNLYMYMRDGSIQVYGFNATAARLVTSFSSISVVGAGSQFGLDPSGNIWFVAVADNEESPSTIICKLLLGNPCHMNIRNASMSLQQDFGFYCPANCLEQMNLDDLSGVSVWGSGPYQETSLICLAAQHRGIISGSNGGVGRMVRFRSTSHNALSKLYPAESANASFQFWILSQPINLSSLIQQDEASATDTVLSSWIPISRGLQVTAATEEAPFKAREGMAFYGNWYVGGKSREAAGEGRAKYFNDIYYKISFDNSQVEWEWRGNAQWTPRAYMASSNYTIPGGNAKWIDMWVMYGGEVGELCFQPVCSGELWLAVHSQSDLTHLQWKRLDPLSFSSHSLFSVVPHIPRCFSVLLPAAAVENSLTILKLAHLGGQISSNLTVKENCTSNLSSSILTNFCCFCSGSINSTNLEEYRSITIDAWNGAIISDSGWVYADGLSVPTYSPFSPRRGMAVQLYQDGVGALLVGGVTITSQYSQNASECLSFSSSAIQLVKEATFFSEIYVAQYNADSSSSKLNSQPFDRPTVNNLSPLSWCGRERNGQNTDSCISYDNVGSGALMGTIPLAVAHASLVTVSANLILLSGGLIPKAAEDDWVNLRGDPYNVATLQLTHPYPLSRISIQDFIDPMSFQPFTNEYANTSRYSLPLNYSVAGDIWYYMWSVNNSVLARTGSQFISFIDKTFTSFTPPSLYQNFPGPSPPDSLSLPYPVQYCNFLQESASDGINLSKWLRDCNFDEATAFYPRVGQNPLLGSSDIIGWAGGYQLASNSSHSSIFFHHGIISHDRSNICAKPNDPSYSALLGGGFSLECSEEGISYGLNSRCKWECYNGWHKEPGPPTRTVNLVCMPDSLWVDDLYGGITRCVAGGLYCAHPLIVSNRECIMSSPEVASVRGNTCNNNNNNHAVDCSSDSATLLTVTGNYFVNPLRLFIGAEECYRPTPQIDTEEIVCSNWTMVPDTECGVVDHCYRYTSSFTCMLQNGIGQGISMTVLADGQVSLPLKNAISYSPPLITQICSTFCHSPDDSNISSCDLGNAAFHSQLIHCSNDDTFVLTILGTNFGATFGLPSALIGDIPCIVDYENYIRAPITNFVIGISCIVPPRQLYGAHLLMSVSQPSGGRSTIPMNSSSVLTLSFLSCPAGSYYNGYKMNGIVCEQCSPGSYYNPDPNVDGIRAVLACYPCPLGYISDQFGLSQCTQCSAGTRADFNTSAAIYNATECFICPPGSFSRAGSTVCTSCSEGTFSSDFGQSSCDRCPAGTFAFFNHSLSYNSTNCSPGSYSQSGFIECNLCGLGTFAREYRRNSSCDLCPPQSFANTSGLSSCYQCPPNSWQYASGEAGCNYCTDNTYIIMVDNNQKEGWRWPCHPCPSTPYLFATANCTASGVVVATPGSWLYIDQSTGTVTAYDCVRQSACMSSNYNNLINSTTDGGNNTSISIIAISHLKVISYCSDGRVGSAANPLCAVCLPYYSEWNGECIECRESNFLLIFVAFVLVFGLVAALHYLPRRSSSILSIAVYYTQMSALFLSKYPFFGFLHISNLDTVSTISQPFSLCLSPLTPMQYLIFRLLGGIFPLSVLILIYLTEVVIRFVNQTCRSHSPTTQVTSSPSTSFLPPSLSSPQSYFPSFTDFIRTGICIVLFTYSTTASAVLDFFSCRSVGEFRVLTNIPAISCKDADYEYATPLFVVFLITFVIGLPLTLSIFLLYNSNKINGIRKIYSSKTGGTEHLLNSPIHLQVIRNKEDLKNDNNNLSNNKQHFLNSASGSDSLSDVFSDSDQHGLNSNISALVFIKRYGVLFLHNSPSSLLYEPYILIRRFLLLTVAAFVINPIHRYTSWATLNIVFTTLHTSLQPHLSSAENKCEYASLTVLSLQTVVLMSIEQSNSTWEVIGLVILVSLPLVLMLVIICI